MHPGLGPSFCPKWTSSSILFMSEGLREGETDRWIGAAMQMLYRPECWEENSALNRSCWFTGASMFHHLQLHAVGSDRKKLYHGYKRRKKGSWSEDCLGFSLDTECWALCQRRGSDEGILLHAERIQLRWFGHLTRMLSGCLYVRCFRHVLLRGGPGADTGHTAEIVSLGWHNNISVSHKNSWSRLDWRGGGLASLLRLLSPWLGLRWAAANANCTDHFTQKSLSY